MQQPYHKLEKAIRRTSAKLADEKLKKAKKRKRKK
jgi:hypothetical protein